MLSAFVAAALFATAPVSPADELALLEAASPILAPIAARASLAEYIHLTFPGEYDEAPHHRLIIEHLEAVERGEIKRLMILMPPRRGKSEICSVRFPAWYLGRNPDRNIIACSHTANLAYRFSRKVRRQLNDRKWPFPGIGVRRGEGEVQRWGVEDHEGGYQAAGVGGPITGDGADILLIDDPIKGREHADSLARRDNVGEWYDSDAETRLAPGGAVVLILTHWHDDDLAGRQKKAMEEGGEQWVILSLPEIAEEGEVDALGRKPGEALWPNRYPSSATDTIRRTKPHVWWPLFQQRPGANKGGIFKLEWMAKRFNPAVLPEFDLVVITIDSAFSEDVAADYSAIAIWGATTTRLYVLDVWRDQVGYPALIQEIKDFYAKWAHLAPWVLIEKKASGQSAVQTLQSETMIPARGWEPKGSKVSRAQDASRFFAALRVYLPEGADWVADWVQEHKEFPKGTNDDRVDTSSMAVDWLAKRVGVSGDVDEDEAADAAEEAS